MTPSETAITNAMRQAIALARSVEGRTAPNPPVGAVALDETGAVLGGHAHQGAGLPHAEAGLIHKLRAEGRLDALHTMVVTLEPCSHYGRTPPCSQALIDVGAKQVFYGTPDPSEAAGGGHQMLEAAGVTVSGRLLAKECDALNAPFVKRATTGLPYITIKRAFRPDGVGGWTMLPAQGDKTFTRPDSLRKAHEIRKTCDGLLTGSGTVIADDPSFTIRHVDDHPKFVTGGAKRPLVLLDKRGRVSKEWTARAEENFDLTVLDTVESAIDHFAKLGCLQILVEAGPDLSDHMLNSGLWDQCYDFYRHRAEDELQIRFA